MQTLRDEAEIAVVADHYIDLPSWHFIDSATNVCCECLKRPEKEWWVSGYQQEGDTLCKECKDPKDHARCCLCTPCARKVGVAW